MAARDRDGACVVAAPGARAQEKQPTANGTGGAAASVDPLATQAAIDVLGRRRQRLRRGGRGGGRAGRGGALQLRHRRRRVHGAPRRRQRPGHDDRQPREGAGGDEARQLLHQRQAADRRAVPDQPLQRACASACPGTPAAWEYLLKNYGTISLSKALSYGVNVATNGFAVDKTFFDQTTGNQAYFDDIPSTREDLPRPRRHVEGRRDDPQEPGHGAHLPADRACGATKGFYTGPIADAIVKSVAQVPAKPGNEHEWKPGLMTARRPRGVHGSRPASPSRSTTTAPRSTAWARRPSGGTTDPRGAQHPPGLPAPRRELQRALGPALPLPRGLAASPTPTATPTSATRRSSTTRSRACSSDAYAGERAALIGPKAPSGAAAVVAAGTPKVALPAGSSASVDKVGSTTHLSVADKDGQHRRPTRSRSSRPAATASSSPATGSCSTTS